MGQGAKGSDGVTAAIKPPEADGSIGYAELSFAKGAGLDVAKIKNTGGQFVGPDATSVAAALASATVPTDLKVTIDYAPTDPKAYPISTVTFVILPQKPADKAKAALMKDFVLYALGAGQQAAPTLYYAPLPASLLTKAQAVAATIQTA